MPNDISIHPGSDDVLYNKRDVDNADELYEQEPVEEFLAVPLNTELIATIDGQKLYTSDNLKKQFLKAMEKNDKIAPILPTIARLIIKGKINICWKTKNPISFAFTKLFKSKKHEDDILGFYWPVKDKIFIMIDSNVNLLGYASNSSLAELMIHESMHMASNSMRGSFLSLFDKELTSYYSAYFSEIFNTGNANISKGVKRVINFIGKEKYKTKNYGEFLKKYAELVHEEFSTHAKDKDLFDKNYRTYFSLITIYLRDPNVFSSLWYKYPDIMRPFYTSYDKLEKLPSKGVRFLAIQETISPDEVVAILSEYTSNLSKVYKAFKSIK